MYPIKDGERCYINHEDLIFQIKSCYYNLCFSNHPHLLGGEYNLSGDIRVPSKLLVIEIVLTLLKVRKDILKATFMRMSANIKVFSKKWNFLSLFSTRNKVIIIPYIPSLQPSIFWAFTLVIQMRSSDFLRKLGCIASTFLT